MSSMTLTSGEPTFESAMARLKKFVYQNRIRIGEFLIDFDKLRCGFVFPNHFMTALSMAGLYKLMNFEELQAICDTYTVPRSPSLIMTDYKTFLNDVDVVFTLPNLEKTPLVDVAPEPDELLDKDRYLRSSRVLPENEERILFNVIQRLQEIVFKRGTEVKPFFDDAAADDNSIKLYGHVTIPQFRQCLSTHLQMYVTEVEASIIIRKFAHEYKPELVNYVAFSNTIDPVEKYHQVE